MTDIDDGCRMAAHEAADEVGYAGVVVDAKAAAIDFHAKYGFTPSRAARGAIGRTPAADDHVASDSEDQGGQRARPLNAEIRKASAR